MRDNLNGLRFSRRIADKTRTKLPDSFPAATITAVNATTPPTVDVSYHGGTLAALRYSDHLTPAVDDEVVLGRMGRGYFVAFILA